MTKIKKYNSNNTGGTHAILNASNPSYNFTYPPFVQSFGWLLLSFNVGVALLFFVSAIL